MASRTRAAEKRKTPREKRIEKRGQEEPATRGKRKRGGPQDPVLPNLSLVVNLVDGPYKDIYPLPANVTVETLMRDVYDQLQDEVKNPMSEFIQYAASGDGYGRVLGMIRTCYTRPFDFVAKYDFDLIGYIERALFKASIDPDAPDPFVVVNGQLDLVRDNKVRSFKQLVGTFDQDLGQIPLEDHKANVFYNWVIQPFFQVRYPNINRMIVDLMNRGDDRQNGGGQEDRMQDDDDRKDDRQDDRGGLNENEVQDDVVRLGHITAELWKPSALQKKYFDDERDKFCKIAAQILANCRWSSNMTPANYRRPTADTLYQSLDILRNEGIITKKQYVGANGRNLEYLIDNLDREEAERDERQVPMTMAVRRRYDRFGARLRAKRDRMSAANDLSLEDYER